MCGIDGFLDLRQSAPGEHLTDIVVRMTATLVHRGPDASGSWVDPEAGIALGHRRLSIIDLTEAGAQPMHSASGRYVISYNGEIYNAIDLAQEITASGHQLRGHCDTEVLLEAIDAWGLDLALERSNGMFAFALWDRRERRLHLVRDRLGEKPLYYGWMGDTLLFASELKSLRAHPAFRGSVDRNALAAYFRANCVAGPRSIYEGVRKLPPGSVLTVETDRAHDRARAAVPVPYWSAFDAYTDDPRRAPMSDADAIDAADELLLDATRMRLRSDVPLGAFLSGGLDSSVVVALMQRHSSKAVRTFTIGSPSATYDEADRAAEIASRLGTDHTELTVTADEAIAVIPRLSRIFDEPFADSSQIPTLLMAELARRDVTVTLSGDGGDEVFGGYQRYRWVPKLAHWLAWIPVGSRAAVARALLRVPPSVWDGLVAPLPTSVRPRIASTKVAKLSRIASLDSPEAMYRRLAAHWDDPSAVVIGGTDDEHDDGAAWDGDEIVHRMMALDTTTFLPDDILVKVDRTTMSVSLEGRIPFLDHRLIELVAALPESMKIRNGESKWLLRRVLERHVPGKLVAGPKSGFGVPLGEWLRGPLRPWADDLLSPAVLQRQGYLRAEAVTRMWGEHRSGRRDWEYHLWDVLMFQSWLEAWDAA
jgi:asparagine synthase (glutamine-hydrolysing)